MGMNITAQIVFTDAGSGDDGSGKDTCMYGETSHLDGAGVFNVATPLNEE